MDGVAGEDVGKVAVSFVCDGCRRLSEVLAGGNPVLQTVPMQQGEVMHGMAGNRHQLTTDRGLDDKNEFASESGLPMNRHAGVEVDGAPLGQALMQGEQPQPCKTSASLKLSVAWSLVVVNDAGQLGRQECLVVFDHMAEVLADESFVRWPPCQVVLGNESQCRFDQLGVEVQQAWEFGFGQLRHDGECC